MKSEIVQSEMCKVESTKYTFSKCKVQGEENRIVKNVQSEIQKVKRGMGMESRGKMKSEMCKVESEKGKVKKVQSEKGIWRIVEVGWGECQKFKSCRVQSEM